MDRDASKVFANSTDADSHYEILEKDDVDDSIGVTNERIDWSSDDSIYCSFWGEEAWNDKTDRKTHLNWVYDKIKRYSRPRASPITMWERRRFVAAVSDLKKECPLWAHAKLQQGTRWNMFEQITWKTSISTSTAIRKGRKGVHIEVDLCVSCLLVALTITSYAVSFWCRISIVFFSNACRRDLRVHQPITQFLISLFWFVFVLPY